MTKIPVKFKSTVSISDTLKDFIKKCLEVNEAQRMSLKDLKEWSFNNSHPRSHSLSSKQIVPPPMDKRFSANENIPLNKVSSEEENRSSKPLALGDATNRQPTKVEKARSFSNVFARVSHDSKALNADK